VFHGFPSYDILTFGWVRKKLTNRRGKEVTVLDPMLSLLNQIDEGTDSKRGVEGLQRCPAADFGGEDAESLPERGAEMGEVAKSDLKSHLGD
jgi:hypothetical protein